MDPNEGRESLWPDRSGWILIGLLALLFTWNLGRVELSVTDEARSGMIVRDIVDGGHWLLPRTPNGLLCEKPPAYYGPCAILGSVFGINEWTLRGVSVFMGLATLLITWILARLYGPPRVARVAVVALASNALFIGSSRDAMVDMTLAFFLTAGLTAYFAARLGRIAPWKAAPLCGIAFGLATLSKGPLGLALPIAVAGGDALFEYRGRFWNAFRWWKQGLVAFGLAVALACLWYVPGAIVGGWEFIETCLLSENFRMPVGEPQGGGVAHRKPFYYYFGVQLAAILPMLPLLPTLIGWAKDRASDPARRHLAAWLGFGFLLFEIAANKRVYYLIPLQPAAALMIALAVERALTTPESRLFKISGLAAGLLVILAALLAGVVTARPTLLSGIREGTVMEAVVQERAWIAVAAVGLLGVGRMLLGASRRGPEAVIRASCALALLVIAVRFAVVDRLEARFDRTRPFVSAMVPKLPAGCAPVVLPPIRGFGIDFYWPGRIAWGETAALKAEYVLVGRKGLDKITAPYETLGTWRSGPNSRDDILLIRKDPLR